MKFTDKFTFITAVVVFACVAPIVVGGLISLNALTLRYHQLRVDSIVKVIESQLDKEATGNQLQQWLPDLLDASGIVGLQIKREGKIIFNNNLENRHFYPDSLLITDEYQLKKSPNTYLMLQTIPPDSVMFFSVVPLIAIGSAISLSIMLL
ncbi:MAG TPA: transcriptional regulator, partial [Psychromonas sp.]